VFTILAIGASVVIVLVFSLAAIAFSSSFLRSSKALLTSEVIPFSRSYFSWMKESISFDKAIDALIRKLVFFSKNSIVSKSKGLAIATSKTFSLGSIR